MPINWVQRAIHLSRDVWNGQSVDDNNDNSNGDTIVATTVEYSNAYTKMM